MSLGRRSAVGDSSCKVLRPDGWITERKWCKVDVSEMLCRPWTTGHWQGQGHCHPQGFRLKIGGSVWSGSCTMQPVTDFLVVMWPKNCRKSRDFWGWWLKRSKFIDFHPLPFSYFFGGQKSRWKRPVHCRSTLKRFAVESFSGCESQIAD